MKLLITTLAVFLSIQVAPGLCRADILIDFESNAFPGSQDHQYVAPLTGMTLVPKNPFLAVDYAVSSRRASSSADYSTAYWSNGDSSVVSAGGANGSNKWISVYGFVDSTTPVDPIFEAPTDHKIASVQINNNAIVAYAVQNGLGGFSKALNQHGEFFRVRFVGFDSSLQQTGFSDWTDLARNTDGTLSVLTDWRSIDLRGLNSQRVGLEFAGSNRNDNGLLTPTYLALDNFVLTAVPEPGSLGLLAIASLGCLIRRRTKAGVNS